MVFLITRESMPQKHPAFHSILVDLKTVKRLSKPR